MFRWSTLSPIPTSHSDNPNLALKRTRVILIPRFSKTGIVVLVNPITLECQTISLMREMEKGVGESDDEGEDDIVPTEKIVFEVVEADDDEEWASVWHCIWIVAREMVAVLLHLPLPRVTTWELVVQLPEISHLIAFCPEWERQDTTGCADVVALIVVAILSWKHLINWSATSQQLHTTNPDFLDNLVGLCSLCWQCPLLLLSFQDQNPRQLCKNEQELGVGLQIKYLLCFDTCLSHFSDHNKFVHPTFHWRCRDLEELDWDILVVYVVFPSKLLGGQRRRRAFSTFLVYRGLLQ